MGNCLKTQLKAVVNNDNLELFDALVVNCTATISDGHVSTDFFQCAVLQEEGKSVKVTLLEGDDIFVKDNYTRISAGESYNTTSMYGYYYAKTNGVRKIKVERLYNISSLTATNSGLTLWEQRRLLYAHTIHANYGRELYNGVYRNTSYGDIEPVVEYRAKYKETASNYQIEGCWQNKVKIHNRIINANNNGVIFCEDTETLVNVRNGSAEGAILATYTKATGEWTYNY